MSLVVDADDRELVVACVASAVAEQRELLAARVCTTTPRSSATTGLPAESDEAHGAAVERRASVEVGRALADRRDAVDRGRRDLAARRRAVDAASSSP